MRQRNLILKSLIIAVTASASIAGVASAKVQHYYEGQSKYLAHTHLKDINYLKKESLEWYDRNVNKKKFYFGEFIPKNHHSADKEIAYLKKESLEWYDRNVNKKKFYFGEFIPKNHHSADKEIAYLKKEALQWYNANSWK